MNSWLLTCTTYGTWLPGDRRWSYTDVGGTTTLTEPQPRLASYAQGMQHGPTIHLTPAQAWVALQQFLETSRHRNWRLYAAAIMYNHFHVVVTGPEVTTPAKMLADLKAYGTRALNHQFGKPKSGTWWTRKGSKRYLPEERALEAAVNYVLHKQPNPLATYPAEA